MANRHQQRGATFSVLLGVGVSVLVGSYEPEPEKQDGMSLVAATQYVGAKAPGISEPLLASILLMNSIGCDKHGNEFSWDDFPCGWWQAIG